MKLFYLCFSMAVFIPMIINLGVMYYICYFKLEEIESHLKNSLIVDVNRRSAAYDRMLRLGQINGMLRARKTFLLQADPKAIRDVNDFPIHLKTLVTRSFDVLTICVIGMVMLCGWVTFAGPIK
ncbi:hypothetical protein [Pseudomonas sp. BGI-2]|uniref:hypothetical protein n=1 Tax=Pseudomonas sp. BGI-2 TaxID=2528211 RepID=UPI0010338CB3|nr:hypothetical protein [Pseudomonas sp. BGI-2]TBN34126.1 hypothetical protein EYC95_27465 [Pseudomonas sp. BGI-2]